MHAAPVLEAGHYAPVAQEISPLAPAQEAAGWGLDSLAGRFIELCAGPDAAVLTISAGLILDAQKQGALTAWVTLPGSIFFPPDFAASGVDLAALPIVTVPHAEGAARAADQLLRSGAFALLILDLCSPMSRSCGMPFPLPIQTRLAGLAKRHNTALVVLTKTGKHERHAGSLVSLRGETHKRRVGHDLFMAELRAVKDKRRAPGWMHQEVFKGTQGLW